MTLAAGAGGAGGRARRDDLDCRRRRAPRRVARRDGFVVAREALLVHGGGAPADRLPLDEPGRTLSFTVGDVIEEHVQVVNPQDRAFVAVVVPLAAGVEPLNPALETAPPEAKPAGRSPSSRPTRPSSTTRSPSSTTRCPRGRTTSTSAPAPRSRATSSSRRPRPR